MAVTLEVPEGKEVLEGKEVPEGKACTTKCEVPELSHLDQIFDEAIQAEEDGHLADVVEEPESEEIRGNSPHDVHGESLPSQDCDGDIAEACLDKLQSAIIRAVVPTATEQDAGGAERMARALPGVVEDMVSLLRKSLRLSAARARRQAELARRAEIAEADARSQGERAARAEDARAMAEADAGQGEKAHELLEGTLARLTAARKLIKDREWELTTVRRRMEDVENDRVRQDVRLRSMETALASAETKRVNATQEARSTAATQRQEELDELRQKLAATELSAEEARALGERRAISLESRLADSSKRIEELEERLANVASVSAAAASTSMLPGGRPAGPVLGPAAAGKKREGGQWVVPVPSFSLAGIRNGQETHVEGVGLLTPTPRRTLKCSLSTRGGVEVASAAGQQKEPASAAATSISPSKPRTRRPSQNDAAHGQRPRTSVASEEAPSMPMDLRALGKLLTGGRTLDKKSDKKSKK